MGIADKIRREDQAARRKLILRQLIFGVVGLVLILFVLYYFILPMWSGPAAP